MRTAYKTWDDAYYKKMLTQFSLPTDKILKEYSKGMKAKLCLVVALAHRPSLLILDEPTSGLDPVVRSEMLDIFMDFISDENNAILMSSHITSDIEKVADYITFIHAGRIVFSSGKDDLLESYAIVKCSAALANSIPPNIVVGRRDSSFGSELLVSDSKAVQSLAGEMIIDKASIDDIMTFTAKGDNHVSTC